MSRIPMLVRPGRRAVTPVAGPGGALTPMLMEYQSPTAALIARPVPLASRYTARVLLAFIAAILAVLGLIPIDRMVAAPGKVTAAGGNLNVQPLDVSLVRAVNVKEGQIVHAGDVLAELDPTFAQADAGSLESQVTSLQAEVDRLTAEAQGRSYLPDGSAASQLQAMIYAQRHAERSFKLENYAQQIEAARVKIAQASADVASFGKRLALASEVEGKRQELERLRVGSQLNRLQATDTRMSIDAQLTTARSQVISGQRERDGLIAERDSYLQQTAGETSQQLTDQGRKLADARENLSKASLRRHLVQLRAEKDAIVLRVAPVSVGTVLQSGDEFLQLVPLDAPLQIDAAIEGQNVGFVRTGNPVTIKFQSFPYNIYGMAKGTVQTISPDSFKNPNPPPLERDSGPAGAVGSLFFRVRISIDEMQVHDLPKDARILPGMLVDADIRVAKLSVLRQMMNHIIPAASEGMREP